MSKQLFAYVQRLLWRPTLVGAAFLLASVAGTPPATHAQSPTGEAPADDWQKTFQSGANVLIYGNPADFEDKVGPLLDHMLKLGFNTVALAVPIFQDGYPDSWHSNHVSIDEERSLAADRIVLFGQEARKRGFAYVILRPTLDEASFYAENTLYGTTEALRWRGNIQPRDTKAWFASYREVIMSYARLADAGGFSTLNLGVELDSMEQYSDSWTDLIGQVHQVYSGNLSYAVNWNDSHKTPPFRDQLDSLGVDAYFELNLPDGASVSELAKAIQAQLESRSFNSRRLLLAEVGIVPQRGAYRKPFSQSSDQPIDHDARARYITAYCSVARQYNAGIVWWFEGLTPVADPHADQSFNLNGSAEESALSGCSGGQKNALPAEPGS